MIKKLSLVACAVLFTTTVMADPKYKAVVPEKILTPDSVQTKYLGELTFRDGFPSDETVTKAYDFLDTTRAVNLFISAMPAASIHGLLDGHAQIGFKANKTVGISENLHDARSLWLTPNTTTPYVHTEVDVKNGPVVLDIGSPVLAIIDDAFFRYVGDIGLGGPDRGKGGKYLIIGPDYQGEVPEGYFVLKTRSYRNWLLMRIVVQNGDLAKAIKGFKSTFKIYPLSQAENPGKPDFFNLSGVQYNTIHANDSNFYDEINEVIQYEPADAWEPEILGMAASIGIKKGKPFQPDARMKKILKEAAAIANASSRATLFRSRNKGIFFYDDRQWYSPLAGGSHEFLNKGERVLADRNAFHYYATGITPLMIMPKVGTGSVYEVGSTDENGDPLDGNKTYKVTLPGPIPIKNFWSFMIYDNQTRSILETDQRKGGVDSNMKGMKKDKDGTVTIYFGPKAPEGEENNWVQTMPGKGFNVLLRIFGPLQPWFDKTWKPSDFELIN